MRSQLWAWLAAFLAPMISINTGKTSPTVPIISRLFQLIERPFGMGVHYYNAVSMTNRVSVADFYRTLISSILSFGISPKEAERIDPQQRLFLQEAWKAVESSGYAATDLSAMKCGTYVGVMNYDYQDLLTQHDEMVPDAYELMGNAGAILAARIAYYLNLKGPH